MTDVASLVIATAGLLLAVPSALLAYRDLRDGQERPVPQGAPQRKSASSVSDTDHDSISTEDHAPQTSEPMLLERPLPLGRRLLGYLVDSYVPLIPLGFIGLLADDGSTTASDANTATEVVLSAIAIAILIGNAALSARTGRSLGKMVVRGRTVDHLTQLPIGLARTIQRNVLLVVPFVGLTALLRGDRRTWPDLFTHAMTLDGRPLSARPSAHRESRAERP